jgi:predicted nucleotidyltransferase
VAGIHEAFVFGSVAKGTDTERSDIDLVVIGSASLLDNDPVVAQIAQGPRLNLDVHGETD